MHKFFVSPDIQMTSRLLHCGWPFCECKARAASYELQWACKKPITIHVCVYAFTWFYQRLIYCHVKFEASSFLILICSSCQEMSITKIVTVYTGQSNCHFTCSQVFWGRRLLTALVVIWCRTECSLLSISSEVWLTHFCCVVLLKLLCMCSMTFVLYKFRER